MFRTVFLPIRWLWIFLLLVACSQANEQLPYYNTPDFTPIFIKQAEEINVKIPHTIPAFSFTDQNGHTVTEKDVENRIHVANFIFTSCGVVCPIMTANMHKVSDTFQNDPDVVLLSYSVTPWIDTVGKLRQYADEKNIKNPQWHLLTGKKADIYQLARQSYFAEENMGFTKDSTEFLHTEHVLLVDKSQHIRGIYNGTLELEINQLIQDIHKLKAE